MKIKLTGVETNNKGAELMLYAILQEVERKFGSAEIFVAPNAISQGIDYINTNLQIKFLKRSLFSRFLLKLHIPGLLYRLKLPYQSIESYSKINNLNYFMDGSGFRYSDQWNMPDEEIVKLDNQLKYYKEHNTKIIFLPQAFGPVKLSNTKKVIETIFKYADVVMPREEVSTKYLRELKVQESKLRQYSDFTSLVKGIFPEQYDKYKGGVCIIPNLRMVDKGIIAMDNYIAIINAIIAEIKQSGHVPFLLNHEGKGDEGLCFKLKKETGIDVVTGLNALEVKGIISESYLCISSRFHGVASALNSCVPCLATSWSHKYEELFKDYGQDNCVLDINNLDATIGKVREFLSVENNAKIRNSISEYLPMMQAQSRKMWNDIWSL